MSAPLPVIVVGAGLIGRRQALCAQAHPDVDLIAVIEPNPQTRAALAQQGLPVAATLGDAPKTVRAAIVATPTPDHAQTGLACFERGWAVLMEKPIAGTLADADRLIDAADAAALPLVVGHHRRGHPFVAETFKRLPEVGDLIALQGVWCLRKDDAYFDAPWRRQPGAGPLLVNLSHELDLLQMFAGAVTQASALASTRARGGPLEDSAAVALTFASGAVGAFLLSDAAASPWAFEAACGENPHIAYSGQDCLRLIGAKGALSFPSLTLWRDPDDAPNWDKPLERVSGPALRKTIPLDAQLTRFVAAANGAEQPLLCDGAQGRAALAATLAVALSAQTGRAVRPEDVPPDYPGFLLTPTDPETL